MANFTVNTTADENDGINVGGISLREAVDAANATAEADTISFDTSLSGQTITLTNGELLITNNLTIDGDLDNNSTPDITVSGNNASRVLNVNDGNSTPDKTVSLEGLTITAGRTAEFLNYGGGIFNAENLSVNNSIISGNSTVDAVSDGGGISNFGSLSVSNSTISNNSTSGFRSRGGGISSYGSLSVSNSTISGNTVLDDSGEGGGIYSGDTQTTISNSTITGNSTAGENGSGGGIYSIGSLNISNSTISDNSTAGPISEGGGIMSLRSLSVSNSTISGNSTSGAQSNGGGISSYGSLNISNSTISGNSTTGTNSNGGGIVSVSSEVGSIISNSTVSGNSTKGSGGGIYNRAGLLQLRNSTVTVNTAPIGQGSGVASVGDRNDDRTEVVSSIIAGNTNSDVDFVPANGSNSFVSLGYNLIGIGNAASVFNKVGDQTNITNPGLAPLANNGGSTQTHALLPGSPGINAGSNPSGLTTDQRGTGFDRSVRQTDIGTFEVQNQAPIAQDDLLIITENGSVSFNLFADNGNGIDRDPDNDSFGISNLSFPSFLSALSINPISGAVLYDPSISLNYLAVGESATEGLTYTISDGIATDTATLTITVLGVNDAPTALALSNAAIAENSAIGTVIGNFSTTDPDTSNKLFTYSLVDTALYPDNTAFTIDDNQLKVNTLLNFEADNSYTIKVRTTDQFGGFYEEDVTIVVTDSAENTTPNAVDDTTAIAAYRSADINVLANDIDPEGDPLQLSIVSGPSNGAATVNNNGTPGNLTDDFITYTPTSGFCGTDSFVYRIDDGQGGTDTATVNITITGANLIGTNGPDNLVGTDCADTINGAVGNDTITAKKGNDLLTGGGLANDTFVINTDDGTDTITDFGGVGRGSNPSSDTLAKVDVLKFVGAGLVARNMLLHQVGSNTEITFEGVTNTKVVLKDFQLDRLDNLLKATGANSDVGNILFNGDTSIQNSFDVFDSNANPSQVLLKNTVTFLNSRNNTTKGFNDSNDVINGQEGNDRLDGLSGDDLLRGGKGKDQLAGNRGNDTLVGGSDADTFVFDSGTSFVASNLGVDTIADLVVGSDKILLDKSTFKQLNSKAGNGFSVASEFAVVASDEAAATSSTLIVYNSTNGKLFYNENKSGSGLGTGGPFAVLSGAPGLTKNDFVIRA
jgi:CSLREA domain-containing protein